MDSMAADYLTIWPFPRQAAGARPWAAGPPPALRQHSHCHKQTVHASALVAGVALVTCTISITGASGFYWPLPFKLSTETVQALNRHLGVIEPLVGQSADQAGPGTSPVADVPTADAPAAAAAVADPPPASAGADTRGDILVKVARSVLIRRVEVGGGKDGNALANHEGTYFASHVNIAQGDSYHLYLGLENRSQQASLAVLSVDAPEGFVLRVASLSRPGVDVVPLAVNKWVISIPPGLAPFDRHVDVQVSVPVNAAVGPTHMGLAITPFEDPY